MSQRIPKALKDAANRIINPDAADKAAAEGMGDLQLTTMAALEDIRVSLRMVQKYCRRTMKKEDASDKDKGIAAKMLLTVAEKSRVLLTTTVLLWQKVGVRPPPAKALRKPPDLSIPSTNGQP